MEVSHYLIFLACFLLLVAMLLFMSSTRKGGLSFTSYLRNRGKLRRIRLYNEALRHKLKREYPDFFVAALLPVPDDSKDGLILYVSWTNFLPAIMPTWEVEGIFLTKVDQKNGMGGFSGVITTDELRECLSAGHVSELKSDYRLLQTLELSEQEKELLRTRGAGRQLPPGLASLGLLKAESATADVPPEKNYV